MEASMNSIIRLVAVVAGLVLLLNVTPSWGQSWNPTASDAGRNTAGGTNALPEGTCCDNTAFGYRALGLGTFGLSGDRNTAFGSGALANNRQVIGVGGAYSNTAVG